jgi:hypothetical protein
MCPGSAYLSEVCLPFGLFLAITVPGVVACRGRAFAATRRQTKSRRRETGRPGIRPIAFRIIAVADDTCGVCNDRLNQYYETQSRNPIYASHGHVPFLSIPQKIPESNDSLSTVYLRPIRLQNNPKNRDYPVRQIGESLTCKRRIGIVVFAYLWSAAIERSCSQVPPGNE